MTDIISAYTELERWQKLEDVVEGKGFYPWDVLGKSQDGIEVDFSVGRITPPENSQYILEWVPVIYSVYDLEEEPNDE